MSTVPRARSWGRVWAWLVAAVSVAMVVASVFLNLAAPVATSNPIEQGTFTEIGPIISALLGAIIIDRKGNHLVGWLFCASGAFWALYHVSLAAAVWVVGGRAVPAGDLLIWVSQWSAFVGFGLAPVLVVFVFPTGALTTPRWRGFFRFAIGVIVVGAVAYGFGPGPVEDLPIIDNPYGAGGVLGSILAVLRGAAWPLLLLSITAGVVSLRQRMKAARFEERQQIKWLLLAGAALVVFVSFWGISEILGEPALAATGAGFVLPLITVAVAVAILRHRLYDIDVLINRTLVYVSLSALLAALYLGVVFLLQRALAPFTADSNVAVAMSTLAVAAMFRPLRSRVQRFIDRRFYRQKYNAAATLGQFSGALRHETDLDALSDQVLAVVSETLQPRHAGLWLKTRGVSSEPVQQQVGSA